MPKPEIPVGSCEAVQHGFLGPASWANVFYFDVTPGGATPGAVISEVATAVADLYGTAFGMGSFPTAWSTTWITVTYRDAADSTVRLRVADAQAGAHTSGYQDAQVCYLINWGTGDPRKGGKPRTYVPGVRDDVMADSAFLDATFAGAVNTNLVAWLEGLPDLTIPIQLVEMSFRNSNAWRTDAQSYPIIGAGLNPVVATQRRRVDRLRPS